MKVIRVKQSTTLGEVLSEAARQPVVVERDGEAFEVRHLDREAHPFEHYDPAAAIAALDRAAERLHGVDAREWKAEIRAARGQAGREFGSHAVPS
jgi:hypothetical protein